MKHLAIILGALAVATSCQKVIDVDLNESNPETAIEANYTAEDSTVLVRVTQTSSYFNNLPSETIDNATVTITDTDGNSTNVPSTGNGFYELNNYAPVFGTAYTLNILTESTSYTATSIMNEPIQMDDITYQYFPPFGGGDPGYAPFLNYQDPAGQENYHLVTLGKNSDLWTTLTDFIPQDDAFVDGNYVERPMFGRELFQVGDTIHMNFRTVDETVYKYYGQALSNAGGNSAAPGNPDSNWDNGALGYFNAYSNVRKSVVVVE